MMNSPYSKPLMSSLPNTAKIIEKFLNETIETLEETPDKRHEESEPDVAEFPYKRDCIDIPLFESHENFISKTLTKTMVYLTQSSLGKRMEEKIIQKIKRNEIPGQHLSEIGNEQIIEVNSENKEELSKRNSRQLDVEQIKILEEQIKDKESLRKTVNENKKKKARLSLFIFSHQNNFRLKQIRIAESKFFSFLIVCVTIVNITAICLEDFNLRMENDNDYQDNISSPTSFYLELGCNIFFFFIFLIRVIAFGFIMGNSTYLKNGWNIVAFIVLNATILIYIPNQTCIQIGKTIRCLRPIAILQEIKSLRKTATAFLRTLITISKVLFQIVFVLIFSAVFGLHLFNGLLESRCRFTPVPINETWIANPDITTLCGYDTCPTDNYCINPTNFNFPMNYTEMDIKDLNYGLASYDNIMMAFLTNMSYFTFTGWSSINDIYGTAFNKIIVSLYSITLLLVMGLVFINLLMAAFYDGFMKNRTGIKAHVKEEDVDDGCDDVSKIVVRKLSPQFKSMVSEINSNHEKSEHSKDHNMMVDVDSSPMIKRILQRNNNHIKKSHKTLTVLKEPDFDYPNFTINYKLKPSAGKLESYINRILNAKYFNVFILLCLILNIIVFAMERDGISSNELFYLNIMNFACTIVFFMEIMIRLMVLSPKKFWKNYFDKLDLLIIVANMTDIIYLALAGNAFFESHTSATSVIKCLKILRIFRFLVGLKFWKRGSVLFIEMIYALEKTKEFIILVVVLIFVGSLLGMEFFAYRVRYINDNEIPEDLKEGSPPRLNYDDIGDALMTTTLICLNEEWHMIMYEHMRIIGKKAGVYFIIILFIGEVILIRMFMALFINGVIHSENIKNLIKIENSFEKMIKSFVKKLEIRENLKDKALGLLYFWKKEVKSKEIKEVKLIRVSEGIQNQDLAGPLETLSKIDMQEFNIPNHSHIINGTHIMNETHHIKGSHIINNLHAHNYSQSMGAINFQQAFHIAQEGNEKINYETHGFILWFRDLCKRIVTHRYFEKVILLTIIVSVIFLMIHNPFKDSNSIVNKSQLFIDVIVIFFYFFEIMLKISAFGLSGPKSFFLDPWNCFDVFLFILTVLGTIDAQISFSGTNFKWCRVFRIFKIIQFNKGLKDATHILFKSIPDLISLLFYYLINLFVFGIIAMNYLKGVFYHCESISEEIATLIKKKEDCFDYGGDWLNRDLNFDNIFMSLSTLFQLSTTEGWIEEMFNGLDYVGNGLNPVKNNHKTMALFYISFFIVANLIVINMFIGILVETYLHQKSLQSPFANLNEEQKEWAFIKESIFKMRPKKVRQLPKNYIRNLCHKLKKTKSFRNTITLLNILNIITFMLYYHRQPSSMEQVLNYINVVIISIFSIEMIIRAIAQGFRYFKKFWNLFDLFIIFSSWVGITLLVFMGISQYRWVKSLVNCVQVLRIARTIKSFKFLNKLFHTLVSIIPQIANIAFLLFLCLISYSVIGVEFFAYLKPQETEGNEHLNFHDVFGAFLNLIRAVTVEQWFKILNDCARVQGPNFTCLNINNYADYQKYGLQGCGTSVAYLYFYSFHIIISLLVVNLFIAMIMNTYDEIMKAEYSAISMYQLDEILVLWKEFDPDGSGFIIYRDFNRFFKKIAIQLGVRSEDFMERKNQRDFLKLLNLPLYENTVIKIFCYRFHDVIISLAQIAVLFNYGNIDLEPEEGIPYLQKYELKLLSDKRFKITQYKSSSVMDFQCIMKLLKIRKAKLAGQSNGTFIFDLFELTKKLKKKQSFLPIPADSLPHLSRAVSKEKDRTKLFFGRRESTKKESYIELNNKAFGGMFSALAREQSKDGKEKAV